MLSIIAVVAVLGCVSAQYNPPPIVQVSNFTLLKSSNQSAFYQVDAPDADYGIPVYLVDLHGSRYQMGWDYGYMLSAEIEEVYNLLLHSLLPSPLEEPIVKLLEDLLDWQWQDYLSVQLPEQYHQELQGIADGAAEAGNTLDGTLVIRAIVLANMPGDILDFLLVLAREKYGPQLAEEFIAKLSKHPIRGQCSMFAAWGSRTESSYLYSGRNLDWNANTGINKYKAITVFNPDGVIPHVVTGYVGLWGALLGMSAEGLTVHEANLEEDEITFLGFPWLLRLRWIMEYAHNSTEAHAMWVASNNTVGFNHMVASAPDAQQYNAGTLSGPGVAVAMETMWNYTAYFTDDDIREKDAMYQANKTATPVHIGFPIVEALWRTNHGYDPKIREHYEWSQAPDSWSMERYMFIHNALVTYQNESTSIGLLQAVNITSIAGDKGSDPYVCQNNTDGSNVLSVAFSPTTLVMAAAWERNNGTNWRPAACSSYLYFDMNPWWTEYLSNKKNAGL